MYLTPEFVDFFNYVNQEPLPPPAWLLDPDEPGMQVLNGQAAGSNSTGWQSAAIQLPHDQYAEMTLGQFNSNTLASGENSQFQIAVRTTGRVPGFTSSYILTVQTNGPSPSANSSVLLTRGGNITIGSTTATVTVGDTFTLVAIGSQISILQNGQEIISVTDSTSTSGVAQLIVTSGNGSDVLDTFVSRFATGSASNTAPPYSVPDCRINQNDAVSVQGTLTYTVQKSSNPGVSGQDCRTAGAPVDSRQAANIPQNSRTPGTYGPNE